MATTSRVHAALNALVDALQQRPGLSGVQIASGWLGGDTAKGEYIALVTASSPQDWTSIGRSTRTEELSLQGVIYVMKPGKGETVIREARARALTLWGEVEDYLRSASGKNIENTVLMVTRWGYEMDQGILPDGRYCLLETEITAEARLA